MPSSRTRLRLCFSAWGRAVKFVWEALGGVLEQSLAALLRLGPGPVLHILGDFTR